MSETFTKRVPANPLRAPDIYRQTWRAYPRVQPMHNHLGDRWVRVDASRPVWTGACCYVFFFDGEAIYVGSTTRFRMRLYAHRMGLLARFDPERVTIKIHRGHRYGDWLMREARLIRRISPACNVVGV